MSTEPPQEAPEMTENPWMDTARMYAQNADYWRDRAERAERFSLSRLIRAVRRWLP